MRPLGRVSGRSPRPTRVRSWRVAFVGLMTSQLWHGISRASVRAASTVSSGAGDRGDGSATSQRPTNRTRPLNCSLSCSAGRIAPGEDDRAPGLLLVGVGAEGEQQVERNQTVRSEDEQRSNSHDHGEDAQHPPSRGQGSRDGRGGSAAWSGMRGSGSAASVTGMLLCSSSCGRPGA